MVFECAAAGGWESVGMAVVSLVVACAALLFTVGSFWWLQARRGALTCYPVQSFSGYLAADRAALRLPLALFNNGAVPFVVTDLRLRLDPEGRDRVVMHFRTTRTALRPASDDVVDFAHPFCVPGRSVVQLYIEFATSDPPSELLWAAPVQATVEARLGHDDEWRRLGGMPLHIAGMARPGSYIAYSNRDDVWHSQLVEEAAAAHAELRRRIGGAGGGFE
jgi:hypothetical protein